MDFFSLIKGQASAVRLLEKSIQTGLISHAYLFVGPEGTGKMYTARAFAFSLLAKEDSRASIYFDQQLHPDLLVIEKEENKSLVGKEQISKVLEPWLSLKPYRALHRVAIIRDAHLMSQEAANALLKTLEEPPEYAVIILVADDNNLLETILSRCQTVRFFPVAIREIEQILLNQGIESTRANQVAQLGQGSISRALRLAEDDGATRIWDLTTSLIKKLGSGSRAEVYSCAEQMEREPDLISNVMETILRDIYIYQATGKPELLAIPGDISLGEIFPRLQAGKLRTAINAINSLKRNYQRNVNSLIISINICYEVFTALQE